MVGAAAACGDIPALFSENSLADASVRGRKGQFAAEMTKVWTDGRNKANTQIGAKKKDSASITAFLHQKMSAIVATDRNFGPIGRWFISMEGEGGQKCLEAKVMALLPDENKQVDLTAAQKAVVQVMSDELYAYCSKAAQGSVKTVKGMIECLLYGRCPTFPRNASNFLVTCKGRLKFFCTGTVDGTSFVGKPLLDKQEPLLDRKGKELTYTDIEDWVKFKYLLSSEQKTKLSGYTAIAKENTAKNMDEAVKKAGASKRLLAEATASSSKSSGSKKGKKPESEVTAALNIFSGTLVG